MRKEQHPQGSEYLTDPEKNEGYPGQPEELRDSSEQDPGTDTEKIDDLEQIRQAIEQEAKSSSHISTVEKDKPTAPDIRNRDSGFKQTMVEVRSQLSNKEASFSKIIHQPTVEKVSDAANKTVGRSSLLLGGFMATFIGSLVVFLNARTNGYSISNLTFIIILFIIGAIAGLAVEFIYRSLRRYFSE